MINVVFVYWFLGVGLRLNSKLGLTNICLGIQTPKVEPTLLGVEVKTPEGDSDTHSSNCSKNEKGIFLVLIFTYKRCIIHSIIVLYAVLFAKLVYNRRSISQ